MTGTGSQAGPAASPALLVLGGSSLVADYLLPRLAGFASVTVAARRLIALPPGSVFVPIDAVRTGSWVVPPHTVVVSLLPLAVLADVLPALAGVDAVVALGSTSRFSKARSADDTERRHAERLAASEVTLATWSGRTGACFTVLRPTLVYDMERDRNLARMKQFVQRFRMLPLARPATGLRQPIHADDVAKAIVGAIGNPEARNRSFNIAGGEQMTYRAMAERVFAACGLTPRLVLLPILPLRLAFGAAARLGLIGAVSFGGSVFQRMNEDLVFDVDEGLDVLGYAPRRFDPAFPAAPTGAVVSARVP